MSLLYVCIGNTWMFSHILSVYPCLCRPYLLHRPSVSPFCSFCHSLSPMPVCLSVCFAVSLTHYFFLSHCQAKTHGWEPVTLRMIRRKESSLFTPEHLASLSVVLYSPSNSSVQIYQTNISRRVWITQTLHIYLQIYT